MEAKVIKLDNLKREEILKRRTLSNEISQNQNFEVNLGHIGFDIFMFLNTDLQIDLNKNTENSNLIKIVPNIDVDKKLMSKNLFILFCNFIAEEIPNLVQSKQDERKTMNLENKQIHEKNLKVVLGYIGFDLFLYTNEKKIFLKKHIQLDKNDVLPDDLFLAYCEKIKKQLPNLLGNFVKTSESDE